MTSALHAKEKVTMARMKSYARLTARSRLRGMPRFGRVNGMNQLAITVLRFLQTGQTQPIP